MALYAREIVDSEGRERFYTLASQYAGMFSQRTFAEGCKGVCLIGVFDEGGKLWGGAIMRLTRRNGFNLMLPLPFSPDNGAFCEIQQTNPSSRLTFLKEYADALAEFILKSGCSFCDMPFPPEFTDLQVFIWKDFIVRPSYTYRINLRKSNEEIWSGFSPKLRTAIRKEESLYSIVPATPQDAVVICDNTLRRNRLFSELSSMERICVESERQGWGQGFKAIAGDQTVSTVWFLRHKNMVYYIFGGHVQGHSGTSMLLWHSIKYFSGTGADTFDFEGSMVRSIEHFFRGFGPELVPYFRVKKASPFAGMLLKIARPSWLR
jgi:hypothetical protein